MAIKREEKEQVKRKYYGPELNLDLIGWDAWKSQGEQEMPVMNLGGSAKVSLSLDIAGLLPIWTLLANRPISMEMPDVHSVFCQNVPLAFHQRIGR